jgi:hypothetical protein
MRGEPIGCANMPPRDVFYFLKGWGVGAWFPIKFPNSSHQIPLVPINIPSKSFCSHQVPKKFPSNSSYSHQQPINILLFSSSSHKIPFVGEHRWARRWKVRIVRDSGRVLNGAPQFVGRHSVGQKSGRCGRAESPDFRPARFCGRSQADLLLAR